MNKEQAKAIIRQVCATYRGTLEEHNNIQMALKVLFEKEEKVGK